jgi:hypothetical protein
VGDEYLDARRYGEFLERNRYGKVDDLYDSVKHKAKMKDWEGELF